MSCGEKYLAIKNWEKYQHLQHGSPAPWFKVYAKILDDPEMMDWGLADLGVWMLILALRSRVGHNLPSDVDKLVRMLASSRNRAKWCRSSIHQRILSGHLILTNQQNGYENSGVIPVQSREREEKSRVEKEPKTPKPRPQIFEIPSWITPEAWSSYLEMRSRIRKPMTNYAMKMAVKILDKLRGDGQDPNAVIAQSVFNSWQGLFPIRNGGNGNGRGWNQESTKESCAEALRRAEKRDSEEAFRASGGH